MKKQINILHLEDLPSDAMFLNFALKKSNINYNLLVVDTKEKYTKALRDFFPDIILSDHSLPSFNSHDALEILHENQLKIPFILVTAAMTDEFAVDILKRGADDYILKEKLQRLPTAIHNILEKFRLEKEAQLSFEELIKNEKHYRALIENIDDAIVVTNVNAELIYQSPSVTRLTGFILEDVKNEIIFNYVHPDDLSQCLTLFKHVRENPGIPVPARYRIAHKEGYYIWTEGTITNLLHDESVNGFILNYRDITRQKKAEEEINFSRLYAESIVSTIRDPLIILTEKLHVRSANTSFYNKFTTTKDLTEGRLLFDLENKQWDIPVLRKNLEEILPRNTSIVDFEISYKFPGLGKRILLLNACAIRQNSTNVPSIMLSIEDITKQRTLDLELKSFSEKLEQQVLQRTLSLYEANIDLQYLNKNLEQFAHVASHDLQEPLRKIRTYASFLLDGYKENIPPDANDLIGKISASADRMSKLIQDLLNFSKILHEETSFEKADFNDIFNKIRIDFELLITEKKAVINCEKFHVMEVIPLQISQLFQNLISNSLKFSNKEITPIISITSRILKPNELKKYQSLNQKLTYLDITVKDNGIGFEQQFASKIFSIFYRLNGRLKFPGTGIGLALCKAIVSNHHGEIYATSDIKNGTIFHIILPITQQKSDNSQDFADTLLVTAGHEAL